MMTMMMMLVVLILLLMLLVLQTNSIIFKLRMVPWNKRSSSWHTNAGRMFCLLHWIDCLLACLLARLSSFRFFFFLYVHYLAIDMRDFNRSSRALRTKSLVFVLITSLLPSSQHFWIIIFLWHGQNLLEGFFFRFVFFSSSWNVWGKKLHCIVNNKQSITSLATEQIKSRTLKLWHQVFNM